MSANASPSPLHSCLYEGAVTHRRDEPFVHAFRYRIFQVYLDLGELDRVFAGRWFWSTSRTALAQFRRSDHFGDPSQPLDRAVRDLVEARTGKRPGGPIRLLTNLRYFGYVINPISIYYCFDEPGERVEAVVAEVTNTPWGERHCYVLADPVRDPRTAEPLWSEKALHVSPFLPMEMRYRWRISDPGEKLSLAIENHAGGRRPFHAAISLSRRSISGWQLSRVLLRYPLITARIAGGIHWQAARLWWKGAPFHAHPEHQPGSAAEPIVDVH